MGKIAYRLTYFEEESSDFELILSAICELPYNSPTNTNLSGNWYTYAVGPTAYATLECTTRT